MYQINKLSKKLKMTYIRKKNFNGRPYVAYASIYDLQLVGKCSFLRGPDILQ